MSLINDALKKAQRLRSEDSAGTAPPVHGGGEMRVAKRSEPRTSQQLVVLASGVVALVVVTVVVTVWLINRPSAPKPAPVVVAAAPVAPKATVNLPPAAPIVVTPVAKPTPLPIASAPDSKPNTPPAVPAPVPTPASAADIVAQPAPPTQSPVRAPAIGDLPAAAPSLENTPAVAPPKGEERIHVFVDAIRVTGIRSSGGDSRVLMNDRVFRVNDIVDRTLGLRLTKVESDSLTFTDGNGAVYVKNF